MRLCISSGRFQVIDERPFETGSSAQPAKWERMIAEFESLGARADNVTRRRGSAGFGLFATDPALPVFLRTPPNLLIPIDQVAFVDGAATLVPNTTIGAREAAFFTRYQAAFSWGADGRRSAAEHIATLNDLPAEAVQLLRREFQASAVFRDETPERRFLSSRAIRIDGVQHVMPVVELVNHSPDGSAFDKTDGVRVAGRFPQEIRVRYRHADPFQIFSGWGFASAEPLAFSLPLALNMGGKLGVVNRRLDSRSTRQAQIAPLVRTGGKAIEIPCLLLGDRVVPGKAREIFRKAMEKNGIADANMLFQSIVEINVDRWLRLDALLLRKGGLGAASLRETCAFQLDVLRVEGTVK